MKRTILLGMLLCVAAACWAVTPQEILGRWVSDGIELPTEDARVNMKMKCDYTFMPDNRAKADYQVEYNANYERKLRVDANYKIKSDATYECRQDSVIIIIDLETIEVEIDEDDVRVTGINMYEGADIREIQTQVCQAIHSSASMPLYFSVDDRGDVLSSVEIDGKKMRCILNGNQPITFKRKK